MSMLNKSMLSMMMMGGSGDAHTLHIPFVLNAKGVLGRLITDPAFDATRNSDKYVTDFEGKEFLLGPHEFMGEGDRAARNTLNGVDTTNTSGSAWSYGGSGSSSYANEEFTITGISSSSDLAQLGNAIGNIESRLFTSSFLMKADIAANVGKTITVYIHRLSTGVNNLASITITLTEGFTAYSTGIITGVSTNVSVGMVIVGSSSNIASGCILKYPTIEEVTLQANQNPSSPSDMQVDTAVGVRINDVFSTLVSQGTGWDIVSGVLDKNADDSVVYNFGGNFVVGQKYIITYTKSDHTTGNPSLTAGLTPLFSNFITTAEGTSGTFTKIVTATAAGYVGLNGILSRLKISAFSVHKASTGLLTSSYANGNTVSGGIITEALGPRLRDVVKKSVAQSQSLELQAFYQDFTNSEVLALGQHRARNGRKYTDVSKAAYLSGALGSYVSSPNSVAASITGDIDIRVRVTMSDWTPTVAPSLLSKWEGVQSSYLFRFNLVGNMQFNTNGTNPIGVISTSTISPANGTTLWLRVAVDVDNGSGSSEVSFYTSGDKVLFSSDVVNWTKIGDTIVSAGVSVINDSTAFVSIGSREAGTLQVLDGEVSSAQIYNGINGTLAVSFDANDYVSGSTLTSSATGEVYTLNGSANTVKPGTVLSTIETDTLSTVIDDTIASGGVLLDVGYHTLKGCLGETFGGINLQSNPFDLSHADWSKTGLTATGQSALAPNGKKEAALLVPTAVSGNHFIFQTESITTGLQYSQIFVVKASGYEWVQIFASVGFDSTAWQNVHLTDGSLGNSGAGTIDNFVVESLIDGYYLIGITLTSSSTVSGQIVLNPLASDSAIRAPVFTGDGTSGVLAWGGDLKQGPISSLTDGTRAAEAYTASLDNLNNDELTFVGNYIFPLDKGDMPSAAAGLFSVQSSVQGFLKLSNSSVIQTLDGTTTGTANLAFVSGEQVRIQVTASSSKNKMRIRARSNSGFADSGDVVYDGYTLGSIMEMLRDMTVPVNQQDIVLVKAFTETDHTGFDE